jgi:hypothetical protein
VVRIHAKCEVTLECDRDQVVEKERCLESSTGVVDGILRRCGIEDLEGFGGEAGIIETLCRKWVDDSAFHFPFSPRDIDKR